VFVVVSRQALIDSAFSSVICAPVYSRHDGLSTQVHVGPDHGLKKESSIHCDDLVSLAKSALKLDTALTIALDLDRFGDYDPTTT
jgi:mRNA interferase MazF